LDEIGMKNSLFLITLAGLVLIQSANFAPVKGAQETTVKAFATLRSEGSLFRVGEDKALFVGGLRGIMFVENGEGELNAGEIVCPAMMEVQFSNAHMTGEGRCIITGLKGNRVFGKWRCAGVALIGCKGDFQLTAGTGTFQGVTGSGPIVFRTTITRFARKSSETNANSIGLSLAAWPRLTYRLN
jgi:hypothetical protein